MQSKGVYIYTETAYCAQRCTLLLVRFLWLSKAILLTTRECINWMIFHFQADDCQFPHPHVSQPTYATHILTCATSCCPLQTLLDGEQSPPSLIKLLLVRRQLHRQLQCHPLILPTQDQLTLNLVHLCVQPKNLSLKLASFL